MSKAILTPSTPHLAVENKQGVYDWLKALVAVDLQWHMDDDPREITTFTKPLGKFLRESQERAWRVCEVSGVDIHLLNLFLLNERQGADDAESHARDREAIIKLGIAI